MCTIKGFTVRISRLLISSVYRILHLASAWGTNPLPKPADAMNRIPTKGGTVQKSDAYPGKEYEWGLV